MAQSAIRYQYSVQMDEMQCVNCGVCFGVPSIIIATRRNEKGSFWCPNGHSQGWQETEADRLRKQLAREQALRTEANAARWKAEEAKTKVERKLRKTEKRIAGGVCPCCNRHFVNVERHMKTKHPDLGAAETKTA